MVFIQNANQQHRLDDWQKIAKFSGYLRCLLSVNKSGGFLPHSWTDGYVQHTRMEMDVQSRKVVEFG